MEKDSESVVIAIEKEDKEVRIRLDEETYWAIYAGRRPEDMDKDTFRQLCRKIQEMIKQYRRGRVEHVSKLSSSAWKDFLKEHDVKKQLKQKGVTYVKKEKNTHIKK